MEKERPLNMDDTSKIEINAVQCRIKGGGEKGFSRLDNSHMAMMARNVSLATETERSAPMATSTVNKGRMARLRLIPAEGLMAPTIRQVIGGARRAM